MRPKAKPKSNSLGKKVSLYFSEEDITTINAEAKKQKTNRSEAIRSILRLNSKLKDAYDKKIQILESEIMRSKNQLEVKK